MSLEVMQMPLASLNEYAGNAKIHDDANVEASRASIRRFGMCDPIGVWTAPDGSVEIVEGHGRKMALEAEGYEVADVIFLDHLTDEERRAYALAHNQTTLMSDFDLDILESELDLLSDFEMESFGFTEREKDAEKVNPYTMTVRTPVYEVKGDNPDFSEIYDTRKYEQLVEAISQANLQKDERAFLMAAATRHIKFDYSAVAEHYAHAQPEVRELMEQSALVIIDYGQAIENGYVRLMGVLEELLDEDEGFYGA